MKYIVTLCLFAFAIVIYGQNPVTAPFTSRVPTDADLPPMSPNCTTTLTAAVTSTSTLAFSVASTSCFLVDELVTTDTETTQICSITPGTLTMCSRGAAQTVAATHTSGKTVAAGLSALNINGIAAWLKAMAAAAGPNFSNVAGNGTFSGNVSIGTTVPSGAPSSSMAAAGNLYAANLPVPTNAQTQAALQAAINLCAASPIKLCKIPAGTFIINTPLNMTGLFGITFVGDNGQATVLRGRTGNAPIVDLTGSSNVSLEHLGLFSYSGDVGYSTIGILSARTTTTASVNLRFVDVTSYLPTAPAANGGKGSIAFYNYGSEQMTIEDPIFLADNGLVISGTNSFGLSSSYQTIQMGTSSTTGISVIGSAESISGIAGPALWLEQTSDVLLPNTYLSRLGSTFAYAMVLNGVSNFHYSGNIEIYKQVADIRGDLFISDISARLTPGGANTSFLVDNNGSGSTIDRCTFRIRNNDGSTHALLNSTGTVGTIANSAFFLDFNESLAYGGASSSFTGNFITSKSNNPTLTLPANSVYQLTSSATTNNPIGTIAVAANYNILETETFTECDATSQTTVVLYLPASPRLGERHTVKKITAPNACWISGSGNNIGDDAAGSIGVGTAQYSAMTLVFDGTLWWVESTH